MICSSTNCRTISRFSFFPSVFSEIVVSMSGPARIPAVHEPARPVSLRAVNFARDVIEAAPAHERALVELARGGSRREWTFGEVAAGSAAVAAQLHAHGCRRGDV